MRSRALLHQQHLPGALDGCVEPALIMRGRARVFARQNASLIGHERAQQVRVLEIERVEREINFRLRPRCAAFCWPTVPFLFRTSLAWHRITSLPDEPCDGAGTDCTS